MLDERLRSHVDSIAPPVELAEVLAREADLERPVAFAQTAAQPVLEAEPGTRSSKTLLGLAGTAAAVLVLVAGVLLLTNSGDEATPLVVGEGWSDEPLVIPVGLADAEWRKVDEPFAPLDAGNALQVNATTVADGVAWAVGFEWRIEFTDGRIDARKRGAIWRSADGEEWAPVEGNFGSLDLPGGNWTPSGVAFEHIVATVDGALWVFGNEYRDTVTPVGFRTIDGQEWVSLELPTVDASLSQIATASVDGDTVLVVIVDDGLATTEQTRVLTSVDGASWKTVNEQNTDTTTGFAATSVDGDVVEITNDVLSGGANGHQQLVAGPGFLIAAGVDSDGNVFEASKGHDRTQVGRLWHSLDGSEWTELMRSERQGVMELGPKLFRHGSGVLAAIQWISDSDAGVALFDIGETADIMDLGRLPSATFVDMFVLNDSLFVVGSETSAALDETSEEDVSIWVAESSHSQPADEEVSAADPVLDSTRKSLESRAALLELVANARSTVAANTRRLWQTDLAAEVEGCQTTYGDRSWITTFDSMPQPLCLVVGEEHDLDFWNKGYQTAIVGWPGDERTLVSDSSFETGRMGDLFDVGKHVVNVEPYGEVTFVVIPEELSLMAELMGDTSWGTDVFRGLSGAEASELLGEKMQVVNDPTDGCSIAQLVGDPYSPQFILFGDGTVDGSVVIDVASDGATC